ncbi:aminotransferase class V-fold PLP-dependent enzyme [Tropicimonas isoalkanivorans]|uniref:Selenocysteine lyase/Cysteine desulfurase n=1 Tax=Tropicimonas isoalkanivorans TaxID=441112 RepID=A0A1I1HN85_9RHOB|nr:aminotransferase class V-fold PLP-dependent enzyme [Tropicimonas isoalkanivorans]SFC22480.1 Selenocysteine lyase/Cysteine desulfurase [Tropicimonas isoalkanivorans]
MKSVNVRVEPSEARESSPEELVHMIRDGVIGERNAIPGPFGLRPMIYADYVASGRGLESIESYIRDQVLAAYGNTHTETSFSGRETTALREAARRAIAKAVGATEAHAVVFAGAGATAAVDKLLRGMDFAADIAEGRPPVVFVGPYEHHSNDLPWRECGAQIERICLDADGRISLSHLEERLAAHPEDCRKIGAFSAASNVTGVLSDLPALARILHRHGADFACDFAAAAPYIDISLSLADDDPEARIDAAVFSPHKFIGGPGASGVLVAERRLFKNPKPGVIGGGTVSYVTESGHSYVRDIERREEGGTPNILGDIRAGAVVALKQSVGLGEIERRDAEILDRSLTRLRTEPAIDMLGPKDVPRLGILAFNIQAGEQALHYGFVVALLNDLFGIQARGGCSCAGPYGHQLLKISAEDAAAFEASVDQGTSLMRPGWVRLGFNYFFDQETVDYITDAILFVAKHGTRFLTEYRADPASGVWRHKDWSEPVSPREFNLRLHKSQTPSRRMADISTFMQEAAMMAEARALPSLKKRPVFAADVESLRWFWMPEDAAPSPGNRS